MTTTHRGPMQAPLGPDVELDELISRLVVASNAARTRKEAARRRTVYSSGRAATKVVRERSSAYIDDRPNADAAALAKAQGAPAELPVRLLTKAERMSAYWAWNNFALCHHGQGPPGQPHCPRL